MDKVADRLDALESRMAHQDKTIADLNEVITAQWKKLDLLERQLRRLDEDMQSLEQPDAPTHQKPPHY